jgi:predicted RNA-binding protein with TRAM domain
MNGRNDSDRSSGRRFGGRGEGRGGYGGGDRGGDRRGGGGGFVKSSYFLPKPVKVGDEVDLTIEAEASRGDGIAKKEGFVIFVKDAKQGDVVKARITEVRARYALAQVIGKGEAKPEEASEEQEAPEAGAAAPEPEGDDSEDASEEELS